MTFVLHYAPDNASLAVRLALEELGQPYRLQLVDRRAGAHRSAAYLALNPNGLIPVLETPHGPLFETAAILLWLADAQGALAPPPADAQRGRVLTWLLWLSNTLHATERMLFYPEQYVAGDAADVSARTRARLCAQLDLLEAASPAIADWLGGAAPSILDCYAAPLLRWPALYAPGAPAGWYDIARWPRLRAAMARFELRASVQTVAAHEGLGAQPFTRPQPAQPSEGSPI